MLVIVSVVVSSIVAYGDARQQTATLLLGALGSVGIGMIVAIFLARNLVLPIRKLAQAARLFGQGQLEHRVDIQRGDELGDLAASFNQMAGQLQASRRD